MINLLLKKLSHELYIRTHRAEIAQCMNLAFDKIGKRQARFQYEAQGMIDVLTVFNVYDNKMFPVEERK